MLPKGWVSTVLWVVVSVLPRAPSILILLLCYYFIVYHCILNTYVLSIHAHQFVYAYAPLFHPFVYPYVFVPHYFDFCPSSFVLISSHYYDFIVYDCILTYRHICCPSMLHHFAHAFVPMFHQFVYSYVSVPHQIAARVPPS